MDNNLPKVCNMCGKTFDFWDEMENLCFDNHIGFGSSYDLHHMKLNLCCQCFDKIIDWILPQCKYNPFSEEETEDE